MSPRIEPRLEAHTHLDLPDPIGYIVAILVGLFLIFTAWLVNPYIGFGWAMFIGFVGAILIIIGFLRLLFG